MKNKKLLDSMSLIDEKFVTEAAPEAKRKNSYFKIIVLAASIAATLAVFAVLWLFVPYTYVPKNLRPYAKSEYYGVISALNSYNSKEPIFNNNFDRYKYYYSSVTSDIIDGITLGGGDFIEGDMNFGASAPSDAPDEEESVDDIHGETNSSAKPEQSPSDSSGYFETTDNQVDGVIESDIIKRSDKYIFYLSNNILKVYSIEKEDSALVAEKEIFDYGSSSNSTGNIEMFLSSDVKTLTVIVSAYSREKNQNFVHLISFDVSDPKNEITETASFSTYGNYLSARLVNGDILLMTRFYASDLGDFSDESSYIPQIDCGNGFFSVPADSIIYPEKLTTSDYTVICRLDSADLALLDTVSLLSYSQSLYVSAENIYAVRNFEKSEDKLSYTLVTKMSEITRISYSKDSFEFCGSVSLEGYIKDQYCLDEYEGILRTVTTTDKRAIQKSFREIFWADESDLSTSASLYCIDIEDMTLKASVVRFAPKGETVRSARFDGDTAYVCTAIKLTDPVFFFDLSDINNITYTETGNIEGYSSSLVDLGDGYLLGIGYGNSVITLKIEIYKESGNSVVSVCKYELNYTFFSEEYKSYYINREEGLVGLGIEKANGEPRYIYLLLHFDGSELCEILRAEFPLAYPGHMRGVLIDGYFYIFAGDNFSVQKIY